MNATEILKELGELYPGKPIKQLPETNPAEIVCEFESSIDHPEWSKAVAVIDRSAAHLHKHTTEIYHILKGMLTLHVNDDTFIMYEGQQFTVRPGSVHWATGDETWVEVYCTPAYSQDDHILVDTVGK